MRAPPCLLAVVTAVLGCGSSNGTPASTECAPWTLKMAPGTMATAGLEGGALVLRRPAPTSTGPNNGLFNGDDLALTQVGLTGAFDVKVEWEALQTGGGVWSQVEAGILWNDPVSGDVIQATGSVGGNGGVAVLLNNP